MGKLFEVLDFVIIENFTNYVSINFKDILQGLFSEIVKYCFPLYILNIVFLFSQL